MNLASVVNRPGNTPQTEPATHEQIENNARGFVFAVDEWTRLDRFLILGSSDSYYESGTKLTKDNAKHLLEMIIKHGTSVVDRIIEISDSGRAPKQDYGIFALAACAGRGDEETRKHALKSLPKVCRTGSTLLQFVSYIEQFRGWGRLMRTYVSAWYKNQDMDKLAYQLVKYDKRHEWMQRDVLRMAHPSHEPLLRWAAKKEVDASELPQIIRDFTMTKEPDADHVQLASVLPREALPTEWLSEEPVWEALLFSGKGMPLTAMLRNIATMTRVGLLKPGNKATQRVVERLSDVEHLRAARVHPVAILVALRTYEAGRSPRSENTWIPVPEIVKALDDAFYLSFANVVPANKRMLIGLDVSGSMSAPIASAPFLTAREACAAMCMIQVATEEDVKVFGFTAGSWRTGGSRKSSPDFSEFTPMPFSKGQRLNDITKFTSNLNFGATDCAMPMLYALAKRIPVDTFLVYTDSETYAGSMHPFEALKKYRRDMNIPAKLVVVATVSSKFTIADPSDAGMLDCCGFDTAMPGIIADFAR